MTPLRRDSGSGPSVLVGCEFSAIVRDAFRRRGFDAWSCDLRPTEGDPRWHIQGDVRDAIRSRRWHAGIFHPDCTYLTNSGVRWLHERPERWALMYEACDFFNEMAGADIPFIALENPVPHGYATARIGKYTQTIQPWQFGHGETKRTCLWLKNLPPLTPTAVVEGREARVHRMAPGPDRQKERSRFFPGIAAAMAEQWGPIIETNAQRRAA